MPSTLSVWKKCLFIPVLLIHTFASAQQWTTEQYSYDSLSNIVYGIDTNFYGVPETLRLDLKIPRCTEGSFGHQPLALCIHGGAFLEGNKEDPSIQDMCRRLAKRGYVAASINYRLGFIGDDQSWSCNFPNYTCLFAGDSAEWVRAAYRAIQDAKGAIRYLTNRSEEFGIDRNNVFVIGESAGAIAALGAALLDTLVEKPVEAGVMSELMSPNSSNLSCSYYQGLAISGNMILRPDLGPIEGAIENIGSQYIIRGVGNFYGALNADLLQMHPQSNPLPAIFSFHQPCDLVVPIDSGSVFWGLSWCFINGYNCFPISNNEKKLYGSRTISNWNDSFNYGYDIENHFTSISFPYSYLIGSGSCLDQVNNPCHAYDDRNLRLNELFTFFASHITGAEYCLPSIVDESTASIREISLYPLPASDRVHFAIDAAYRNSLEAISICSLDSQVIRRFAANTIGNSLSVQDLPTGIYFVVFSSRDGNKHALKLSVVKD